MITSTTSFFVAVFVLIQAFLIIQITKSQATTIIVASISDQTTTTTITPTIGQSVELRCITADHKQWYTTGSQVKPTSNEISTKSGATRILAFSSFTPSHAGTYTCLVSSSGDTQTKTTYPVVLVNPSAINTIRVGKTDDPTTTVTITPTLSQPVKLECERTGLFKNWYTDGTVVTPTNGKLTTIPGVIRTILISSFSPSHAKGYTCTVTTSGSHSAYPVILKTPPSVPEIPPPSQVERVMLTGNGTSLTVSWTAVTGTDPKYAIGYVVRYSSKSQSQTEPPFNAMKRSGITDTSTTLNRLQSGTTYYVWVAAEILGAGVQGPYSMRRMIKVLPQVQGVTLTRGVSDGSPFLAVSWTAVSGSEITYTVRYSTSSGTTTEPPSGASTIMSGIAGTSTTLSGLTQGIRYYIWVAAVSSVRQGPYSTRVSETTFEVPGAPTNLMISPPSGSCDQLMVTWTAPSSTVGLPVRYKVYRNGDEVHSMRTTTTATWSGLTGNTQYTVRVVAFNDLGDGGEVTGTGRTRPQAPSISSLSASSSTKLIITLTAPARSSSLTYECIVSTTVSGLSPKTVTGTVLQYTVNGLSPYVTYTVECTSSNGEDSCNSNMDTIRMLSAVPSGPPLSVMADTSSTSTTLRWDPPTERDRNGEITGYVVKYKRTTSTSYNNELVLQGSENSYTITDLMEGNEYTLSVGAMTVNGTGPNATIVITTVPIVENLRVSKVTARTINITWDAPPDGYTVDAPYAEATDSSGGVRTRTPANAATSTWHRFSNLNSFREYRLFVRLRDSDGNKGSYSSITARTLGKVPTGKPKNFSSIPNITFITVEWSAPDLWRRNGIIFHYIIEWGEIGSLTTLNYSVPNPTFNTTDDQRYTFSGLEPITEYTFNIAAVNINGTGPVLNGMSTTLEEVPGPVRNLTKIPKNNDNSITISWDPPEPSDGYTSISIYIIRYGVLDTSEVDTTVTVYTEKTINNLDPGIPYYITVSAGTTGGNGSETEIIVFSKEEAPTKPVNISTIKTAWSGNSLNISWEPLTLHEARGFPVFYIYLNDSSGPAKREIEPTANTTESSIVIEGLDSSQTYVLAIGVATRGGENLTETVTIQGIPLAPQSTSAAVAAGVVIVLFLIAVTSIIVVIGLIIGYKRGKLSRFSPALSFKRAMREGKGFSANDNDRVKRSLRPIPKEQFLTYFKQMSEERNSGFENEYETIVNDPNGVETIARGHRDKNRYVNIYTFDHSRVVLSVPDENGSDYINASYIDGYNSTNSYIASQGPTPDTISDFWQMIWDSKTPVIVMLTQPEENGKRKCECYWKDDSGEPYCPGRGFTVVVNRCLSFADYQIREITLRNDAVPNSKSHYLQHFLYTGWPDHGVPQHPSSLVRFTQKVRNAYMNSPSPMVVHCSAGVGRTGTFITIDAMIQRLKERDDLNIYEFVTEMRSKRTFMVQNQDQYVFIHEAMSDYLTCGDTALQTHELRMTIQDLETVQSGKKGTGFKLQFEMLANVSKTVNAEDKNFSKKVVIAKKNRYKDKFPYYVKYIMISGKSQENGGSYYNSSYVNSYSTPRAFIAAQSPMSNTRDDFWEVVWQTKPLTIVLLCDFNEMGIETCCNFWPKEKLVKEEYSFLRIETIHIQKHIGYTQYSINVSDKNMPDPNPHEITLFHTKEWKRDTQPQLSPLLSMMGEVQKIQQEQNRPCVVMCNDGMGRTGVFITAMSEIERVKVEGEIDLFQTVKAIRVQRPNMVSTVDQYKLCHEILQAYLDSFDTYANFKAV